MKDIIIGKKMEFCPSCLKKHDVDIVTFKQKDILRGVNVEFDVIGMHCSETNEYFEEDEQLSQNMIRYNDAYKKKMNLLTSSNIKNIRKKYAITQNDLCVILGWGAKTITRYESFQVQDRAHDNILRKIDSDPQWFIELLNEAKEKLPEKSFNKYLSNAKKIYHESAENYFRIAVDAYKVSDNVEDANIENLSEILNRVKTLIYG